VNDLKHIHTILAESPYAAEQGNQVPKNALPVRAFAWVGRFALEIAPRIPTQVGICLLLSFFFFSLSSFADTTFVSGAVSGEWTRDGNPYIVVDSTWVPEGERLIMNAGVSLLFQTGTSLSLYSTFESNGTAEAPNRIEMVQSAEPTFGGIIVMNRIETEFHYTTIDLPGTAFVQRHMLTILLDHSTIYADFAFKEYLIPATLRLQADESAIHTTHAMGQIGAVILNARNSIFDCDGFQSSGGDFTAYGCTFYGTLTSGSYSTVRKTVVGFFAVSEMQEEFVFFYVDLTILSNVVIWKDVYLWNIMLVAL
jgi:hypothetical protein